MSLEFLYNGGGLPPAYGHGYEKCIIYQQDMHHSAKGLFACC